MATRIVSGTQPSRASPSLPVVVGAVLVVLSLGAASLAPLLRRAPGLALLALVGSAAWLVTGQVLVRTRTASASGRWLTAAGALWPAGWAVLERTAPGDPGPYIGVLGSGCFWVCIAWGVFSYPRSLGRTTVERRVLVALSIWLTLGALTLNLIGTAELNGFHPQVWWFSIEPLVLTDTLFPFASTLFGVGTLALAAWVAFLLARRLSSLSRFEQRILRPTAVAMTFAALTGGITSAFQGYSPDSTVWAATLLVQGIALLCVPLSLFLSFLRGRLALADAASVVGRLPRPATALSVQDALRKALQDDTLELLVGPQLAGGAPLAALGQHVVSIADSKGRTVAVMLVDERLNSKPELLDVARDAASFALENAELQAQLERSVQDVRASRARIATVSQHERRRLERNLHDGAQQRLVAVALSLEAVRSASLEQGTRTMLGAVKEDLDEALSELRSLAQGLNPSMLSSVGLAEAVRRRTGLHTFPVRLSLDVPDLPEDVREAVYYAVCEALTNTQKHGKCTSARADASMRSRLLVVRIADDGVGGADPNGGGLRGLADRVEALGGTFHIDSPPAGGTIITLEIPCA